MKLLFRYVCIASAFSLMAANAHAVRSVSQQLKDPKAADVVILGHVLEPKQISVNNTQHKIALRADLP